MGEEEHLRGFSIFSDTLINQGVYSKLDNMKHAMKKELK